MEARLSVGHRGEPVGPGEVVEQRGEVKPLDGELAGGATDLGLVGGCGSTQDEGGLGFRHAPILPTADARRHPAHARDLGVESRRVSKVRAGPT